MSQLSLRSKLTILIISITTVLLVIATLISLSNAKTGLDDKTKMAQDSLIAEATLKLESIRDNKKANIEGYFNTIIEQNLTFAQNVGVIDATKAFKSVFHNYLEDETITSDKLKEMKSELYSFYSNDFSDKYVDENSVDAPVKGYYSRLSDVAIAMQHEYIYKNPNSLGSKDGLDKGNGSSKYHSIHETYHPSIRAYLKSFEYYDIFLVDIETGHIIYSVFKELDFGSSLKSGPNSNTNFAECFRKASELDEGKYSFVDFAQYTPSYEAPASFIGTPIYDGDKKIAVAIFQMPLDTISATMSISSGLGETGESYLVGQDKLMRSDTFKDQENRTVVASFKNPDKGKINSLSANNALLGTSGTINDTNYLGKNVISSSAPMEFANQKWAIVVEAEIDEVLVSTQAMIQSSKDLQTQLLFNGGILVIISIVVTFLLTLPASKYFSQPIERNLEQTILVDQAAQRNQEELESVAKSVEEITDVIKEISESSTKTASTTMEAVRIATSVSSEISALSDQAEEINETLQDISSIASKTDLIALNATIEAASAGEAGKSFAVVAGEVKSLAEKISVAAENINQKMRNIQLSLKEKAKDVSSVATENQQIEESTSQLASAIEELSITSDNINTSVSQVSNNTADVIDQLRQSSTDLKVFINGQNHSV